MQTYRRKPSIHESAKNNDLELVKECLQLGVSPAKEDKLKNTPIHYATINGNAEMVEILLSYVDDKNKEVRCINKCNREGMTALDYAHNERNKHCYRILLKNGAHIQRLTYINQPSHISAILKHSEGLESERVNISRLLNYAICSYSGTLSLVDKKAILTSHYVQKEQFRKQLYSALSGYSYHVFDRIILLKQGLCPEKLEINKCLRTISSLFGFKRYYSNLIKLLNFGADMFYLAAVTNDNADETTYHPLCLAKERNSEEANEIFSLYPQTATLQTLCIRLIYRYQLHIGYEKIIPKLMLKFPNEIEDFKAYQLRTF